MTKRAHEFVLALKNLMRVIEADYQGMIIGGMAVIALGYPRVTTDIDATVLASLDDLGSLIERLQTQGIVPRMDNVLDFARDHHVLLMRHESTGIDIDITVAMLPFEEEAIFHRQVVDFAGVNILIPRVDDLIIYKMVASRSEDLRDVEELLLRHMDRIDLGRVTRVVSQFAEVLEDPDMVRQLEDLIKQARR